MYSPEKQILEICLLKSNLDEIEDAIVVQHTALPGLEFEIEQQCRLALEAVRVTRALNGEVERLKLESAQLVAKRLQLKRQCEEASGAIRDAKNSQDELMHELETVEADEQNIIRKYEDLLREKADRFRKTHVYYNKSKMAAETANISATHSELATAVARRASAVDGLRRQIEALSATVPAGLPDVLGKARMHEKIKQMTEKWENLEKTRNAHLRGPARAPIINRGRN